MSKLTQNQQAALDYFDKISKDASAHPDAKQAVSKLVAALSHWSGKGWENCITGGHSAPFRWFRSWHSGGMLGGLQRFDRGLKRSLIAAVQQVKQGSARYVQGFEPDGTPHFDRDRGPYRCSKSEAASLVAHLNVAERERGTMVRYRTSRHARSKGDERIIVQYQLVTYKADRSFSLDHAEEEGGKLADKLVYRDEAYYVDSYDDGEDFLDDNLTLW